MKKIFAFALMALFGSVVKSQAAVISTSISSTTFVNGFAASAVLILNPNESLTYTLQGSATGTFLLEKSIDGSNFVTIQSTTNNRGGTFSGVDYSGDKTYFYRWRASTMTGSAPILVRLEDNDDFVFEIKNNKHVPGITLFDDTVRLSNSLGIKMTDIIASTATDSRTHGNFYPYYLDGSVNGLMGQVVVATSPVAGQGISVVAAPAAVNQTRVVGVIKSSTTFSGPVDIYQSGNVLVLTTGTIIPGDILGTSNLSAGYLQVTQSSNPVVAISLGNGIAAGGLLKVRLK